MTDPPKSDSVPPEQTVPSTVSGRSRRRSGSSGRAKPTIRSVAERANVAVSTVSRVINGGYASAESKQRVEAAIAELGYFPSITAQSLVTGRAGCIGVATYTSQTSWFSQILAGVEAELVDSRQSVLLTSLSCKGRYDASAVASWIEEHRVDGIIFVRYTNRELPLFEASVRARIPVVLIGPDEAVDAESVIRCDNVEAGRLVGEHLAGLGHRSVAFAGGPQDSLDTRDRLRGLQQSFASRGQSLGEARIWFGPNYSSESGAQFAQAYLAQGPAQRPTAVVLGNDAMAMGFLRVVLSRGVRVPEQLSVVGFDGIPEGALYWPGLTSVVQPAHEMGATGCRALLDCMSEPLAPDRKDVQCPVSLVVRESTGPVRLQQ